MKHLSYKTESQIDEILEKISENFVGIGEEVDLGTLQKGDGIVYLAGKIFETECVAQDIIVEADPKNKASEFASAGDGKIKGAYRNVSGANGAIWWKTPQDFSAIKEALKEEWSNWEIKFDDLFEVKGKEIKANVSYEGTFGEMEIALIYPDGVLRDPPWDSDESEHFMELSLEDEEEAEEKLEEESDIIGYTTGDCPYLATIITKTSESIEVDYWVLPDSCYRMSDIRVEVDKLWSWLKKELS